MSVHGHHPRVTWVQRAKQAGILLLAVALGLVCGVFIGRSTVFSDQQRQQQASSALAPPPAEWPAAVRALPPPGSDAAQSMLSDPATPADIVALYTFYSDSSLITEQATVAFLQQLQGQLRAVNATAAVDVEPFVRLARDVLSYLRWTGSQALLLLLRQYAATNAIRLGDVSPDELQAEATALLNTTRLDQYLLATATRGGRGDDDGGSGAGGRNASVALEAGASTRAAHTGRRLRVAGMGHGMMAAVAMPNIPAGAGALPTDSPPQSVSQMLCEARSFASRQPGAPAGAGSVKPALACPPAKPLAPFSYKGATYKPVVLPVVFHCFTFLGKSAPGKEPAMLPPVNWGPEKAAQRLIDVTNQLYKGTGVQFKLQEVRTDPAKHRYLGFTSIAGWQQCTTTDRECIGQKAADPSVAKLSEKYVINVFVGGSASSLYCDTAVSPGCKDIALGTTQAYGPWWGQRASTYWTEKSSPDNWLWLMWDMFDPGSANSERFWDGGGITLAHELGHYLGLMHTHEGECDGEGLTAGDGIPDTPSNRLLESYVDSAERKGGGMFNLTAWCIDFRQGKAPETKLLSIYSSCPRSNKQAIDNVFNLLSYLPDPCNMVISPNQVARLQWIIATFRPKMMAAHAA